MSRRYVYLMGIVRTTDNGETELSNGEISVDSPITSISEVEELGRSIETDANDGCGYTIFSLSLLRIEDDTKC